MSKERFFVRLKESFYPRLRASGFTGSGRDFRRVCGEVVHAINIQSHSSGVKCAVNLGIHLTFLPLSVPGGVFEPKTIREIDCEFRRRISPDGGSDHWWSYGDDGVSPEQSADSLVGTFFDVGSSYFEAFSSVSAIVGALDASDFSVDMVAPSLGGKTKVRAALTAARIHAHFGNREECRRFASIGLTHIGRALALKEELEGLAQNA